MRSLPANGDLEDEKVNYVSRKDKQPIVYTSLNLNCSMQYDRPHSKAVPTRSAHGGRIATTSLYFF